jgi:hypothetical protein
MCVTGGATPQCDQALGWTSTLCRMCIAAATLPPFLHPDTDGETGTVGTSSEVLGQRHGLKSSSCSACIGEPLLDRAWQLLRLPNLAPISQGREWERLLWSGLLHADDMHIYYNMASFLWKARLPTPPALLNKNCARTTCMSVVKVHRSCEKARLLTNPVLLNEY